MRIGDLAKQLGVTPKTLRHYERVGLLGHPGREGNNYRAYDAAAAERMRVIVGMRALGLSLEQVGMVLRDDARGRREKLAEWLDRETQELSGADGCPAGSPRRPARAARSLGRNRTGRAVGLCLRGADAAVWVRRRLGPRRSHWPGPNGC